MAWICYTCPACPTSTRSLYEPTCCVVKDTMLYASAPAPHLDQVVVRRGVLRLEVQQRHAAPQRRQQHQVGLGGAAGVQAQAQAQAVGVT